MMRQPDRPQMTLTPEIEEFSRTWLASVTSTASADCATAEAAFAELYDLADLPRPSVEWCRSPVDLDLLESQERRILHSGNNTIWFRPLEVDRTVQDAAARSVSAFADRLRPLRSARSIARTMARARVGVHIARFRVGEDESGEAVSWRDASRLARAVVGDDWLRLSRWLGERNAISLFRRTILDGTEGQWLDNSWPLWAYHGQFDLLPPILEIARLGDGLEMSSDDEARLRCWLQIGRSCGAWKPFEGVVRATERPVVLSLDEAGRPHREDGPAIAFGDGMVVHAWHGLAVRDWIIHNPERITIQQIDAERDIEERRVLLERFGVERFLREGDAELVHEDATGRLWRRELPVVHLRGQRVQGPAAEPVVMVEVTNATPEPDGSRRTYFLRVPPHMRTARDAVAWTFSMTGSDYSPSAES